MKTDHYDEIINQLRRIEPLPESDNKLTDAIIDSIGRVSHKRNRYIAFKGNEQQWNIFNVIRIVLNAAAVFLAVFFVIQQWQINNKLNQLGKELNKTQQSVNFYNTNKLEGILLTSDEFHTPAVTFKDSLQNDIIKINRKSLNYMLNEIEKLKNENQSFRERLQQLYTDSSYLNSKLP